MKKTMKTNSKEIKEIKPHSNRKITLIFFSMILLIIIIVAFYLAFFNTTAVQLSPNEEGAGFSYENARALVIALGNEGISWYCGTIPLFKDSQGNIYGTKELAELKRVLGHEQQLKEELCK